MTEQQAPTTITPFHAAVAQVTPIHFFARDGCAHVERFGLHQGLWDVTLEVQIGVGQFGQFGQGPADVLPGATMRISRVG
jgi:hypothetical protein